MQRSDLTDSIYHIWEDELPTLNESLINGIRASASDMWYRGEMIYFTLPADRQPWLHRALERHRTH